MYSCDNIELMWNVISPYRQSFLFSLLDIFVYLLLLRVLSTCPWASGRSEVKLVMLNLIPNGDFKLARLFVGFLYQASLSFQIVYSKHIFVGGGLCQSSGNIPLQKWLYGNEAANYEKVIVLWSC